MLDYGFPMSLSKTAVKGKRLLIDAALRLTAATRSLTAISLRELAREAGLNPNTFYRHFKDFDDLGLAIIEGISADIRKPLRDLRRQAAETTPTHPDSDPWQINPRLQMKLARRVTRITVKLFFDYVASNPNAFILGVRELHGSSPAIRGALEQVMREFSEDIAEDIVTLNLLPRIADDALGELSEAICRDMFQLSMDCIEQPEERASLCAKAERLITAMAIGQAMLQGHGTLLTEAMAKS